ncbi:MAG: 5-bromo-4-chloroindolyl phosphate hydrolysis family protein [Pseudomonadota bacterium]
MAKRFGGKFSPDGATPGATGAQFQNRRARAVNIWARLLFFAPLPLLLAGIGEVMQSDPLGMVAELGSFALMLLGAWLVNEGLRAADAYEARAIAKPPAVPRKLLGAVCLGLGIFGAHFLGAGAGLIGGLVFGAVGAGLTLAAFGLDPMKSKGISGHSEFDNTRVANAIEKAEGLVKDIQTAAARFGDRSLEDRVDRLCAKAREVFKVVEEDPRDLPRARKFLSVYLMGARDATVKFADLYGRNRSTEARRDYEALLSDLETSFAKQREQLLLEDRSDLDIEIDVLRQRLRQEGLTAE